jgi:hypothetical protein
MVTSQFGGPDLLEERDVDRPGPGPGEVLARVVAAGTNPMDAKFRAIGGSMGLPRADERTRTADLISLRVPLTSARSGVAGRCRGLQIPLT